MTQIFEPIGEQDSRLVAGATGLLAEFNAGGLLEASDLHVATRVGDLGGESDERVLLGVALAVRAVRHGSVCVDLATVRDLAPELLWPQAREWSAAIEGSPLLAAGAVRLDYGLLYLDRYHRQEVQVRDDLHERATQAPPEVDEPALAAAVQRIRSARFSAEQEDARCSRGPPMDDRAHRWPRHRQDHHGRAAARAAGRPGPPAR